MTHIELNINGRIYPVACAEADAPRIRDLGRQLQERASKMLAQFNGVQVTEAHLMVLLNLMMMDELSDLSAEARSAKAEARHIAAPAPSNDDQEIMVKAVEHLTARVISIADRLKAA